MKETNMQNQLLPLSLTSQGEHQRVERPFQSIARQPGEPTKAYAAFKAYMEDGSKRSLSVLAKRLGKTQRHLENWSSRWNWQGRLEAYDDHLALLEQQAAEALVLEKAVDWAKRYDELRQAEWEERMNLVRFAAEIRRRWMTSEKCGTLEGYARLLDLASTLGRRACEAAIERKEITGPDGGPIRVEVEAALKKIYGKPLPGEVVDVEVTSNPQLPSTNS